MRVALVGVVLALSSTARADDIDDLVTAGEALAKTAEYTRAIEMFKVADAKRPRAKHACLIGLAYTRRELWPQAELFLSLCRARATPDDPLPEWIDAAEASLTTKLAAIHAAPITIVVTPQSAGAKVTISTFTSDESFPPRMIHLGQGRYSIEASAAGYVAASRELVIESEAPQTIAIALQTPAELAAAEAQRHPDKPRAPLFVIGAGGAVALAGLAYQLLAFKPARDRLAAAPNTFAYDDALSEFRDRRDITLAIYSVAAATIATGVVLRVTSEPRISATIAPNGAAVAIGWSR